MRFGKINYQHLINNTQECIKIQLSFILFNLVINLYSCSILTFTGVICFFSHIGTIYSIEKVPMWII